jgi:hypothetical protein
MPYTDKLLAMTYVSATRIGGDSRYDEAPAAVDRPAGKKEPERAVRLRAKRERKRRR